MDTSAIVEIYREFFYKGFEILMPIMAVSLIVVLVFAILMTVMQIQEQTLTFVPKLLMFVLVLYVLGPWMFDELVTLIGDTWDRIADLV